jgi:hypothetical protein
VPAFNVRVFSPDGDCATDRIGAGFRTSEKMQCAKFHLVSICTSVSICISRSGTYAGAIGLFGWRQSRVEGHHA